eukprot:3834051-Amphidinium_carterae.1
MPKLSSNRCYLPLTTECVSRLSNGNQVILGHAWVQSCLGFLSSTDWGRDMHACDCKAFDQVLGVVCFLFSAFSTQMSQPYLFHQVFKSC